LVDVRYIPPGRFVEELAKYLKENFEEIRPPEWAFYAKTGSHVERVPDDPDWWYKRCASLLRKLYLHGPVGVERLRTAYGGRKDMGTVREHFRKAGGSAVRKALQQLEAAGLVTKVDRRGRALTPQGRALLDRLADRIFREMARKNPELRKYI